MTFFEKSKQGFSLESPADAKETGRRLKAKIRTEIS
jgi:hypothetical protein